MESEKPADHEECFQKYGTLKVPEPDVMDNLNENRYGCYNLFYFAGVLQH